MSAMHPTRGTIADRPWGCTLGALGVAARTVQLILRSDEKVYRIAFDRGVVIAASSPLVADAAVRIALTGHFITPALATDIKRRIAAAPSLDEVDVLAAAARLAPDQVRALRFRIVTQRAARTFSVDHGEYELEDRAPLPIAEGGIDVGSIIYTGVRMNLSEERLAADLRRLGTRFLLEPGAPDALARFGFTRAEQPVIDALRRGTSLPELEVEHRDLDPRVAQAVIYALASCGALVPSEPLGRPAVAAAAPAAAAPAPDASAAASAPAAGSPRACPKSSSPPKEKTLADDLIPIGILIVVITVVVIRLPRVPLGHSIAFRRRRLLNWLPLGLTYSFLYFGRYNIKQFQGFGLTEAEYGTVFGVGSMIYGISFLLNGPLTDRWGGRATILISAAGSGAANLLMGYMAMTGETFGMPTVTAFSVAFAINMYFQSFGAVSIVKVNAAWFHLRERGTFGGIFGILISLGLYFAYDIGKRITEVFDIEWLFFIPCGILFLFFVLSYLFVRNNPSDAGHEDFDLGDATRAGEHLTVVQVFVKLITHPVILTIAIIELCSGFLRQAILQWGVDFGKGLQLGDTFVFSNWGMVSCIAGITGGMFAGAISDHLFQSRRSPVSGVLYGVMLGGAILLVPMLAAPAGVGWVVAFMSMAIIGVHGMLTATASADFAGKKNTGMAVGLIDGFVYVGSTIQSFLYGATLPASKIRDANGCLVPNPEAGNIDNWRIWPYAMIPVALIGFLLTLRIWNAKPTRGGGGH